MVDFVKQIIIIVNDIRKQIQFTTISAFLTDDFTTINKLCGFIKKLASGMLKILFRKFLFYIKI